MQSVHHQTGYIAVLFAAILAFALTLTLGTLVAHLKKSGALQPSFTAGANTAQQNGLIANQRKLLNWYQNNAYSVDSNPGQPNLSTILNEAGIQLAGASASVSYLLNSNGIGYHVFAFWFPVPGSVGTGLDATTGIFSSGTLNGVPANTPYVLASGFSLESLFVQKTRTNMYRIADLLENYFDDQVAADADNAVDTNWFREATCATNAVALPCYGTDNTVSAMSIPCSGSGTNASDVPISQTVIQKMVGLSNTDMITAWNGASQITVNNYTTSILPPFSVSLRAVLPWGCVLTVDAVSN